MDNDASTPLFTCLSLSAPVIVSLATFFFLFNSSPEGGLETNLSYSSAVSKSDGPVSKSICFLTLVLAMTYLSISGGTRFYASIGPIVFPLELDIGPLPLS